MQKYCDRDFKLLFLIVEMQCLPIYQLELPMLTRIEPSKFINKNSPKLLTLKDFMNIIIANLKAEARKNMVIQTAFSLKDISNKTDEELAEIARDGDKDALEYLLNKYKDLVEMKVSKYFIIGAEKEDIVQEGLIGLYKAIKCFDKTKENSFKSFANLCIERQLITAIKTSNRQKHMPLNSSISLNATAYDDDSETELLDKLDMQVLEDPLETITKKEYYKIIETKIDKNLSSFEKQVLARYARGESYVNIAEKLEAPVKSIDNAIQRIRKKATKSIIPED